MLLLSGLASQATTLVILLLSSRTRASPHDPIARSPMACSSSDEVLGVLNQAIHQPEAANFCREFIGIRSTTETRTITPTFTVSTTETSTAASTVFDDATFTSTTTLFVTSFKSTTDTISTFETVSTLSTITDTTTSLSTTSSTTIQIDTVFVTITSISTETVTSSRTTATVLARAVAESVSRHHALIPSYLTQYPDSRISSACLCLSLDGDTVTLTSTAASQTVLSTGFTATTSYATVTQTVTAGETSESQVIETKRSTEFVTVLFTSVATVTEMPTVQDTTTAIETSTGSSTTLTTTTSTQTTTVDKLVFSTTCARLSAIPNSGFEVLSPDPWQVRSYSNTEGFTADDFTYKIITDESFAHGGARYARFYAPYHGFIGIYQAVRVCPGRDYQLSYWARAKESSPGSGVSNCYSEIYSSDQNGDLGFDITPSISEWVKNPGTRFGSGLYHAQSDTTTIHVSVQCPFGQSVNNDTILTILV